MEALPWKPVSTEEFKFDNIDDTIVFGIEEIDANTYEIVKSQLGTIVRLNNNNKKKVNKQHKEMAAKNANKVAQANKKDKKAPQKLKDRMQKKLKKRSQPKVSEEGANIVDQQSQIEEINEIGDEQVELENQPVEISEQKTKKRKREKSRSKKNIQESDNFVKNESHVIDGEKEKKELVVEEEEEIEKMDLPVSSLTLWAGIELHPVLLCSLEKMDFLTPTPIQEVVLPRAIRDRKDVIGAAETGSGKTLAYGLPIMESVLRSKNYNKKMKTEALHSLILVPTRELALQVTLHLKAVVEGTFIRVVTIVGGLAEQKQERLLGMKPEIVVATPGRLWEMIQQGNKHLEDLSRLHFLVIDEADRMVDQNHYQELDKLFEHIKQCFDEALKKYKFALEKFQIYPSKKWKTESQNNPIKKESLNNKSKSVSASKKKKRGKNIDELGSGEYLDDRKYDPNDEDDDIFNQNEVEEIDLIPPIERQTLIFSATLTLEQKGREKRRKHLKNTNPADQISVLEKVMGKVGMRGKPAIIDLTKKVKEEAENEIVQQKNESKEIMKLPEGLKFSQIRSLENQKDLFLYYFLSQYPGRTVIFLNSIKGVRRLAGILQTLEFPALAIHAQLQQRQRLKSLDTFRANERAILVATDVAARGLDIPQIEHVVHYDLPRSTEIFIHRSGRTARGKSIGMSLSIVSPADERTHRQVCEVLKMKDFDEFPIQRHLLTNIHARVQLANQIIKLSTEHNKHSLDSSWFSKAAKEAEIEFDDYLEQDHEKISEQAANQSRSLKKLKAQLYALVSEPLYVDKRKFINVALKKQELEYLANRTALQDLQNSQSTSKKRKRGRR